MSAMIVAVGAHDMPAAEVELSIELVERLLIGQHPDLADLAISELANGWDNAIYRLGDEFTIRLPRRSAAARLIDHEQSVLPQLATRLPIPIPAPVRVGVPTLEYPWSWSVTPWFDGDVAARSTLSDSSSEANRLGSFMSALHVAAPESAPPNPYRGHHIGENSPVFADRVGQLANDLDEVVEGGAAAVRARWSELIDVRPFAGRPRWLHADMHTANVLVHDGRISAVIDFGDVCAGDPANDLAVAWMLFDADDRAAMRDASGNDEHEVDDAMWQRSEAWALHFAVTYLALSGDNPLMQSIGERLIATLFA